MRINIFILLIVLFTTSCDDFLDVRPEGEVVNDELFEKAEGFEDALYGVYSYLTIPELYGQNLSFYLNDVLAQYFINDWSEHITQKFCLFDYKDQDVRPVIDDIWNKLYKNISNTNNILANLENKKEKLPLYKIYKAEALALRAFMHFEILKLFASNYEDYPNKEAIPYYSKSSYEIAPIEICKNAYAKVIQDFKDAEQLLSESEELLKTDDSETIGFIRHPQVHMNIYAVQALLSRVYWTMGDLENAKEYALKVIDSDKFELEEKIDIENCVSGGLSDKETVFGLFSNNFKNTTKSCFYVSEASLSLDLKSNYVDFYKVDKDGTDYRWEGWFKENSDFFSQGLRCMKIADIYDIRLISYPPDFMAGINIIRIPELFYIVSEYYLKKSDQKMAKKYLDAVLTSRGLNPTAANTGFNISIKNINNERRKEFIGEGLFFHVMKKYKMEVVEIQSLKKFNAEDGIYDFPIPELETEYRQ